MIGTYIGIRLTPESEAQLRNLFRSHFTRMIDDLHATIIYAPEDDVHHKFTPSPYRTFKATVTGKDVFGKAGDKWEALVLKLDAPALSRRHEALKKVYKLRHSYPEFNPHVSIKYQPTSEEKKKFLEMDLANFKLELAGEYIEPIKGD